MKKNIKRKNYIYFDFINHFKKLVSQFINVTLAGIKIWYDKRLRFSIFENDFFLDQSNLQIYARKINKKLTRFSLETQQYLPQYSWAFIWYCCECAKLAGTLWLIGLKLSSKNRWEFSDCFLRTKFLNQQLV